MLPLKQLSMAPSLRYADFIYGASSPDLQPFLSATSTRLGKNIVPVDILGTVSGMGKLEVATLTFSSGGADCGRL